MSGSLTGTLDAKVLSEWFGYRCGGISIVIRGKAGRLNEIFCGTLIIGLSDRKCGYADLSLESMQMLSLLGAHCLISNYPGHNVHIHNPQAQQMNNKSNAALLAASNPTYRILNIRRTNHNSKLAALTGVCIVSYSGWTDQQALLGIIEISVSRYEVIIGVPCGGLKLICTAGIGAVLNHT